MDDSSGRRTAVAGLFDQLAPGYDQGPVPWFRPIAARLVDLVAPAAGESALDIGAGRGAATFPLCDRVGPEGRVTAVDLSAGDGRAPRAPTPDAGAPRCCAHRSGEARADLLPDAPYDVVTASLVLFFDPDPEATLREWLRLVRPGTGRLGLSTFGPVDDAWRRCGRRGPRPRPGRAARPPHEWDARTLRQHRVPHRPRRGLRGRRRHLPRRAARGGARRRRGLAGLDDDAGDAPALGCRARDRAARRARAGGRGPWRRRDGDDGRST